MVLITPCPALTEVAMKAHTTAAADLAQQTLTIKLRLKDKHASELKRMARLVNIVWNYCNETQQKAVKDHRRWLSCFDLQNLTSGTSKEMDLHSHTIKQVCKTYETCRRTQRKAWLRFRGRKSLGWVPFSTSHVTFDGCLFKFRGITYQTMHMHPALFPGMKIGAGSFNEDKNGHWYLNVTANIAVPESIAGDAVGIDLGLHSLATLSTGQKIEAPRFYRASEEKLAAAQRARKVPKRIRNIHAKIVNRRKDFLHKASISIAKQFALIVVGDVSAKKLAKTNMAKSVFDAGWSSFKNMLRYKAIMHGGKMIEADERYTTQSCSCCGSISASSPKGRAGLNKRNWACDECKAVHDRDINSALNILRVGLNALAEGAIA